MYILVLQESDNGQISKTKIEREVGLERSSNMFVMSLYNSFKLKVRRDINYYVTFWHVTMAVVRVNLRPLLHPRRCLPYPIPVSQMNDIDLMYIKAHTQPIHHTVLAMQWAPLWLARPSTPVIRLILRSPTKLWRYRSKGFPLLLG